MKTLFTKIAPQRLPEYKIMTKIVESRDGNRVIEKIALTEKAFPHLARMVEIYPLYQDSIVNPKVTLTTMLESRKDCLKFEYVEGVNLDAQLCRMLLYGDKKSFYETIRNFYVFLNTSFAYHEKFDPPEGFMDFFESELDLESLRKLKSFKISNLDLNFDNIIYDAEDQTYTIYDLEWIFDFPISVDYLFYRTLSFFHKKHPRLYSELDLLKTLFPFGIQEDILSVFNSIELSFGRRVNYAALPSSQYLQSSKDIFLENQELNTRYKELNTILNTPKLIQLFYDAGEGFNEAKSIIKDINTSTELQEFVFDLSSIRHLKSLRLDPLNDSTVVSIEKIYLKTESGEVNLADTIVSNAAAVSGQNYFFEVVDPSFSFNLDGSILNNVKVLIVRLSYEQVGLDALRACAKQLESQVSSLATANNELSTKNSEIESRIPVLESQVSNLTNEVLSYANNFAQLEEELKRVERQYVGTLVSNEQKAREMYQAQALILRDKEQVIHARSKQESLLREEISELKAKLENVSSVIDRVLSSTSWKVTEPLRKMLGRIRAFKARFLNPFYLLVTGQFARMRNDVLRNSASSLVTETENIEDVLIRSNIFNETYYMLNSPACCSTGLSPIQHYVRCGVNEGKEPCILFDSGYYLSQFDSRESISIKCPAYHYIVSGSKLGKNPYPLFDESYYKKMYMGDKDASITALQHFLTVGRDKQLSPHPLFDPAFYLEKYPDVAESRENPWVHYVKCGQKEGRVPSPDFCALDYKDLYPDVCKFYGFPLEHYSLYGQKENRLAKYPKLDVSDLQPASYLRPSEIYIGAVDVIVPVYCGLEETRNCIESVLRAKTKVAYRLVVINDASPEQELNEYLEHLSNSDSLLVLRNTTNIGFVSTVNKGMMLDSTRDVVLLKSDTLVPDYWLDRLLAHAVKDLQVATITPVSNNATRMPVSNNGTICSYPIFTGSQLLPEGETLSSMNELCYTVNAGRSVEVPTGVGYCMFIRRESLHDVGYFDEEAFGKGCGEENDFCLRANKRGWKNIHALDVYVYHRGEVSFKENSSPSKINALRILSERYPDYLSKVSRFIKEDQSRPFRFAMTAQRFARSLKPCVVLVEHALGGVTEKHTKELLEKFKDSINYLILRPVIGAQVRNMVIYSANPEIELELEFNSGSDFDFIVAFLQNCGVIHIHIHDLFGFSLDVRKLINSLDISFDFTVHDYLTICPQRNLLDRNFQYCGEPDVSGCHSCVASRPSLGAHDIIYWRESYGWFVKTADRVICPSYDVAERMRRFYPTGNYFVVPHEPSDYVATGKVCALPNLKHKQPLRVGILGAFTPSEGSGVAKEVASLLAEWKEPIELFCIEETEKPTQLTPASSFDETGQYVNSDIDCLIREHKVHVLWFPTPWPEIYSYTLSAALRSKLPIVASRLGTFTERLTGRKNTWLIEPNKDAMWLAEFFKRLNQSHNVTSVGASELDPVVVMGKVCLDFYEQHYLSFCRSSSTKLKSAKKHRSLRIVNLIEPTLDGCGHIRLLLPLKHEKVLDEFDVRVLRESELKKAEGDIFISSRIGLCDPESMDSLHEILRNRKAKFVYEIDDDLINLPSAHPDKKYYNCLRSFIIDQLQMASQVWVSTPCLAAKLSQYNENIHLIPNYIDEKLWLNDDTKCPGGWAMPRVRILYMGTHTHQADFGVIKGALKQICSEFGDAVEFCMIGVDSNSGDDEWYTRISIPQSARSSYPAFVNWLKGINDFSIGVAPLVDNDFNRSKSGLKFLDYSALGLCSICSKVESYNSLVINNHNGLLVGSSEEEWYDTLKFAVSNPEAVTRMRMVAHRELRCQHTVGANIDKRIDFLRAL